MNRRSNLVIFALLLLTMPAVARAQQPMVIAPVGGPDPYAMAPTSTNPYLWGNGFAFPTANTLIRDRFWVSLDYLYWWTDGMNVVPLVTTGPVGPPPSARESLASPVQASCMGAISSTTAPRTALGCERVGGFVKARGRSRASSLASRTAPKTIQPAATEVPSWPGPTSISSVARRTRNSISFPNTWAGSVAVSSDSRLKSGLINVRASLIPVGVLGCNDGCDPPDRVDWIIGYRALELKDSLSISDSRTSLNSGVPVTRSQHRFLFDEEPVQWLAAWLCL